MSEALEFIKGLFSSPEFVAIFTAIMSWLTLNIGTVILFAVKYIRLKAKEIKEKADHDQVVEALTAKYEDKLNAVYNKIDNRLEEVENVVVKKVAERAAVEEEQVRKESENLAEAIRKTKEALENAE